MQKSLIDTPLGESLEWISDKLVKKKTLSGKELHLFKNPYEGGEGYLIEFNSNELTSLCPVTGHPDFCELTVGYIPDLWCLELKSVKFYIESFRNEGHFYEELINLIYYDLSGVLIPHSIRVNGEFHIRGGIPESITVGVIDI